MKEFLQQLFEYNYHTNQQLADEFLAHQQDVSQKSVELFSHILNSHRNWNMRMLPNQERIEPWAIHSIHSFKEIDKTNLENSKRILNSSDLDKIVEYAFKPEVTFQNTVGNLLFNIINHSTYHRAQIATEFRAAGISPLSTDYFFYTQKVK